MTDLVKQALKSDATLIKPGAGGRYVFEHNFDNAIGINREGQVANSLRVVLDKSGKVITDIPVLRRFLNEAELQHYL